MRENWKLPLLRARDVVQAFEDPMRRLGFRRDPPWLAVADPGKGIAASWMRGRDAAADDPRLTGDWEQVERNGNADGVSVWREGHINIGIAGTHARLEWRTSMLEADELALSVEAFIGSLDGFAPPQ